jgi:MFS family permease
MPEYPDLTRFLIANLFFWLSLGSFINFFTKYMEYYVNIPGTQAGLVLGTVVIISILLAVPVGILADKMSRKKLAVAGMVLIFAGLLVGYFTIGPRSVVSAKDLASGSDVLKLADKLSISAAGVDLTLFEKKDFTPKFDVNKDEMFDKKSDVMRWCLNGALEEKDCRGAVEKVMGSSNPSLDSTKTFLVKMRAEIVSKTKPVLTISYIVIAFTAIGLTMCFLIMAAILPTLMPMEKMGLYMGFYSSVTGAGQLLSLAVAGFMIDFTLARNIGGLGYRWIFIQGIVCMAIAALTMNSVPYVPNANEPTVSELKKAKQAGTLK